MAGMENQQDRPVAGADLAAGQHQAHHLTPHELSWSPNSHSTSESAKHWKEGNEHSRHEKLAVDAHGNYAVTGVDALSTIAERNLHTHGMAKPSGKEVHHEMDRIAALNKDAYPDLASHPDLLQPGMELHMRGHHKSHPTHMDIPPMQQSEGQATGSPRPQQSDVPVGSAPGPAVDSTAPYYGQGAPQSDAQPVYAQPQAADAGQGIANFFGSIIGGIGGGFLAAGAFGRGYGYRGYHRGWDPYDQNLVGANLASNAFNLGFNALNPGASAYDPSLNAYDPNLALYNQGSAPYNYGWGGGYNHPWHNRYWRGR
jgi:hypothetical protein